MTMQQKMWAWHTWNHVIALIGLYLIFTTGSWGLLAVAVFFGLVTDTVANISLHRYLSHKSFKTGKYRDIFLRWISIYAGLGPSVMWVIAHRQHHADSDTDHDYQNPRIIGKFNSWFTIYPKTQFKVAYGKDIIKCKHSRFIHKHYFKIQAALYISLFLINPWLPIVALAIPMVMTFHGAAAIGVLTHIWGYRVIETRDKSTNNWLASIISFGEGWHNSHHGRPGDYRHGHQWWELDPPAWIIEKFFKVND
jgi:stearoyl-CoA desaturase (delta-9 desaturase)